MIPLNKMADTSKMKNSRINIDNQDAYSAEKLTPIANSLSHPLKRSSSSIQAKRAPEFNESKNIATPVITTPSIRVKEPSLQIACPALSPMLSKQSSSKKLKFTGKASTQDH